MRKDVILVTLESTAVTCVVAIREQAHTATIQMVTVHVHQDGMVFIATASVLHRLGAMVVGILVSATTTHRVIM